MLTRRTFLQSAIAAGIRTLGAAEASQPSTSVRFEMPPHACDCHTHYYGDPRKFPLGPQHVYTPEGLQPEEMGALHRALHVERVVIVTPSVYGTDNSATLFYMKIRGATARGIAVVDEKTSENELDAMRRLGIRGGRIIATPVGLPDPKAGRPIYQAAVERFHKHNWHIQIYADLALVSAIRDLVQASNVPTVFDHFGGLQASRGLQQAGFSDLLELVRPGHAYVKISGAYRSSQAPDYADLAPFAKALIEANPDRILWGSDWPHPAPPIARGDPGQKMPLFPLDDARLLNLLPVWAPDPAIRRKILVDNPKRLFGF